MKQPRMLKASLLTGMILSAVLAGCSGLWKYSRDRALDLTDILDAKYSFLTVAGIGAKVEATDYVGAGLGFAGDTGHASEWYGRGVYEVPGQIFLHLILAGVDEMPIDNAGGHPSITVLGYNGRGYRPRLVSRFRFGAEVIVPAAHVGLYVNAGEIVDFIAGFATLDPAGDDDFPKGSKMRVTEGAISLSPLERIIPHAETTDE